MTGNHAERRTPLSLLDSERAGAVTPAEARIDAGTPAEASPAPVEERETPLRRTELSFKALAEELAEALGHLERASLAAKGTGFSARVRDAFDEVDRLQRAAAGEFGRAVGDRMGRETLWRRQRGIDVG